MNEIEWNGKNMSFHCLDKLWQNEKCLQFHCLKNFKKRMKQKVFKQTIYYYFHNFKFFNMHKWDKMSFYTNSHSITFLPFQERRKFEVISFIPNNKPLICTLVIAAEKCEIIKHPNILIYYYPLDELNGIERYELCVHALLICNRPHIRFTVYIVLRKKYIFI